MHSMNDEHVHVLHISTPSLTVRHIGVILDASMQTFASLLFCNVGATPTTAGSR